MRFSMRSPNGIPESSNTICLPRFSVKIAINDLVPEELRKGEEYDAVRKALPQGEKEKRYRVPRVYALAFRSTRDRWMAPRESHRSRRIDRHCETNRSQPMLLRVKGGIVADGL